MKSIFPTFNVNVPMPSGTPIPRNDDRPTTILPGWRLVPVNPTKDMEIAMDAAIAHYVCSPISDTEALTAVYLAILAAAPSPPKMQHALLAEGLTP
jgi:hypothetical protein